MKKFFSVALVLGLFSTLLLMSVSAAPSSHSVFQGYVHLRANDINSGLCLNVYGTNSIANNRKVTVYAHENTISQNWMAVADSTGYWNLMPQVTGANNQAYVLEVWTGKTEYYKADVYQKGMYPQDSALTYETTYNSAGYAGQYWQLAQKSEKGWLTAISTDGSIPCWFKTDNRTLWYSST